ANIAINLFGRKDSQVQGLAAIIRQGLQRRFDFLSKGVAICGRNHSLRLPSGDVEKDLRARSALNPSLGFAPIDVEFLELRWDARAFMQHQQPLVDQPLVESKRSVESTRGVPRHYQHGGLAIE